MARLKAEEGIPRHKRDNDTEIRQARPYYRLKKLLKPTLGQRNGPAQDRIEETRHNVTSPVVGHPSKLPRSTSGEPPETSNRKRIHHPDANSNISKAQKRAHGNSPLARIKAPLYRISMIRPRVFRQAKRVLSMERGLGASDASFHGRGNSA